MNLNTTREIQRSELQKETNTALALAHTQVAV